MSEYCSSLNQLIQGLKTLPGIGDRSALRHALHLLSRNRNGGKMLAQAIEQALSNISSCNGCNNYTDQATCHICLDAKRDDSICVVENPIDLIAIEKSGCFRGKYFVLMGQISPLDGIGPEELKIPQLIDKVKNSQTKELILATSSTVEGEATAYYIYQQLLSSSTRCTRLALGIPVGGELEYLDTGTLSHAIQARQPMNLNMDFVA